jgi:hypothetical protein
MIGTVIHDGLIKKLETIKARKMRARVADNLAGAKNSQNFRDILKVHTCNDMSSFSKGCFKYSICS